MNAFVFYVLSLTLMYRAAFHNDDGGITYSILLAVVIVLNHAEIVAARGGERKS